MTTNLLSASDLFKLQLTPEEKSSVGALQTGLVRTMADFAKGAYDLTHPEATEYVNINDISPYANEAYNEVLNDGWSPVDFSSISTTLDRGAIQSGMLSDGFYINSNAAACVARCGDAIVLSFRGTNDYASKSGIENPNDVGDKSHPDYDQWTNMPAHYSLFNSLISAFDAYVANPANGIKNVYVTGHSMGGSMALEYMSRHSGNQYQAITFAATPFGQPAPVTGAVAGGAVGAIAGATAGSLLSLFLGPIGWLASALTVGGAIKGASVGVENAVERKSYSTDSRITQIEIEKDTAPMLFDQKNLVGDTNTRPGHVIDFGGNQTSDTPDRIVQAMGLIDYNGRTANHSMDYYRQITDSVDANSWSKILAGTGTQTVLLGGQQIASTSNFIVDGQQSGTDTSASSGNDSLTSIDFKTIYGGKGSDTLKAGANGTLLLGGVGSDFLYSGTSSDMLDGGDGTDTAYFSGSKSSYTITKSGSSYSVKSLSATDTLTNVEYIAFTDDSSNLYPINSFLKNNVPTGSVTISGTPKQGQILSASNYLSDADGLGTIVYQWLRDGAAISGANQSIYTLTSADASKNISVSASYTDGLGKLESVSSSSVQVINVNHLPTGSVTISGTPKQGQILTVSNSLVDLDGLGTIYYDWFDGSSLIMRGFDDQSTYTLTAFDAGRKISVKAHYSDWLGTTESVSSQSVTIRSIKATQGNDFLVGTDSNNTFSALAGNDTLTGGLGADKLTGGKGADTFAFTNIADSGIITKTRDTISDFKHSEGDKMDLSGLGFTNFVGAQTFSTTNATGQLRFDAKTHILFGSTNADNQPEFSILLSGIKSLVAEDFIL